MSSSCWGLAPLNSATLAPLRKNMNVGIARTEYAAAVSWHCGRASAEMVCDQDQRDNRALPLEERGSDAQPLIT